MKKLFCSIVASMLMTTGLNAQVQYFYDVSGTVYPTVNQTFDPVSFSGTLETNRWGISTVLDIGLPGGQRQLHFLMSDQRVNSVSPLTAIGMTPTTRFFVEASGDDSTMNWVDVDGGFPPFDGASLATQDWDIMNVGVDLLGERAMLSIDTITPSATRSFTRNIPEPGSIIMALMGIVGVVSRLRFGHVK